MRYNSLLLILSFVFVTTVFVTTAAGQNSIADVSETRQANALYLNGDGQDVQFPKTDENMVGTTWTMELWIKPDSLFGNWQALVTGGVAGTNRSPSIWIYDTRIELWFSSSAIDDMAQAVGHDSLLVQDEWQHVAGTYDGDTLRIFINAVQDTAVGLSVVPDIIEGNWYIGQRGDSDFFYTGYMDEVRIWNRALSVAEIAENMNNSLVGSGTLGLVGSYGFNQEVTEADSVDVSVIDQSALHITGHTLAGSLVNTDSPVTNTVSISNEDSEVQPSSSFELESNYPNPFSETTRVGFTLKTPSLVTVEVFDLLGRRVIHFSQSFASGDHTLDLDGTSLLDGVYLYRLTAGGITETRKMVILH